MGLNSIEIISVKLLKTEEVVKYMHLNFQLWFGYEMLVIHSDVFMLYVWAETRDHMQTTNKLCTDNSQIYIPL